MFIRCLAFVVFIAFGAPGARAAIGTNFSDQWWNENESGWGASVLQQGDILFVDLFVYGIDTRATWYTAAAFFQTTTPQGNVVYTGDLFASTGPYFGSPGFNPNFVTRRRVGTLTLDFGSVDSGTLTYLVDGVGVIKQVTRQLWKFENFTGDYYGGLIYDLTACANPANNGHVEEFGSFNINHAANNVVTIGTQTATQSTSRACTYLGSYSQAGHMGTVRGNYACSNGTNNGANGSFVAFEMEKTQSSFSARLVGQSNSCQFSGHFAGVQR